ncbi:hypothetical protein [Nostoc sp.]
MMINFTNPCWHLLVDLLKTFLFLVTLYTNYTMIMALAIVPIKVSGVHF